MIRRLLLEFRLWGTETWVLDVVDEGYEEWVRVR